MTAEAVCSAKHLAEALENAVLGSRDKYPVNPTVEVAITSGQLRAIGFLRWTGIIDRRPLESSQGEGSIILDYEEVAAFVKDSLRKMQGFSAKGSVVSLALSEDELVVTAGTEELGRVARSEHSDKFEGDSEHLGYYEYLLDLEETWEPLGELRATQLLKNALMKLKDIKMSRFEDGKWVAAQPEDRMTLIALAGRLVGIEYGSARIIQATAGIVELDE